MRPGLLRHRLAPATTTPAADELAERIMLALAAQSETVANLVWLDSGVGARSGRSFLSADGRRVTLDPAAPVLPQLRHALAAMPPIAPRAGADPAPPLGLIGWFGYELRGETMGMLVPPTSADSRAAWLTVDRGIVLDHATGEVELVALARAETLVSADSAETADTWSGELETWRQRTVALVEGARRASAPPPADPAPRQAHWRDDDAHYAELVRRCQEAIRDGEAYQLCLTSQARVDDPGDPLELYRRVRRGNPAHHGALLRIGVTTLVSASPETFLRVEPLEAAEPGALRVRTRPIKGTRPRGADPAADAALAAELAASEKERAENLMIVDLMRNDLSRVSELGTVVVTGLLEVETYAHVHQLVSTIEGRMRAGLDAIDAVAACFPAGSMTGAPKHRAVELLARWEGEARGVYSGAFGYLAVDGSADLAMVIRSILISDGVATIGAGGGITALSDPEAEVAEMRLKARALLRALGVHSA
jgi:para-aminobenzoate synthetase component I